MLEDAPQLSGRPFLPEVALAPNASIASRDLMRREPVALINLNAVLSWESRDEVSLKLSTS